MHKESKYVLFLDDDVRLHPGTIGALTAEMEKNPEWCRFLFKQDIHLIFHLEAWEVIAFMNIIWYFIPKKFKFFSFSIVFSLSMFPFK
ncbi:hypothetical protein MA16_Dca025416 [Dendrobium catenatum]|uniref:Uncharacterized protein n=1 Tax=Dendrobium catenatum TaxID=906689 RepID=A0A2I0X0M7_9ASPA|nr:hypothetical protein MA16_Dca025416 [Dendrobium catenatum]